MPTCTAPRRARVVSFTVITALVVAASPAGRARAADPTGGWVPPVPGAVVRAFAEPIATYAPGHRGVDLAAASGAPVHAANDGVIAFAGEVAGSLHVVVAHDGGIRTSYSFLASSEVHVGDAVRRGDVIGRAGGSGEAHEAGVLHFGARIGERYVDPTLLFRPRDLTQMVRLVPAGERVAAAHPDAAREQRELATIASEDAESCAGVLGDVAGFVGLGGATEAACDALEEAVSVAWQGLRSLGGEVAALVERIEPVITAVIERMRTVGEDLATAAEAVAGEVAANVTMVVKTVVAYAERVYEKLTSCPQPPPKAHPKGSGNLVVAVGGMGSSRRVRSDGTVTDSFHLEASVLGYRKGEVSYFSYRAGSVTYSAPDTLGDLNEKARLLAEQVQRVGRLHPGRKVDLIAHSQGGVVVDLFLTELYRGHERKYPAVANVVTFASPHEGTPFANLAHDVSRQGGLATVVKALSHEPIDARSLAQLQEHSPTVDQVTQGKYPSGIRFLSIAGSEDLAVPSSSSDPPVGEKVVVQVGGAFSPDDHTGILRDADALSAAQAHLSGGHPADTCGLLVDAQGRAVSTGARAATAVLSAIRAIPPDTLEPTADARAA